MKLHQRDVSLGLSDPVGLNSFVFMLGQWKLGLKFSFGPFDKVICCSNIEVFQQMNKKHERFPLDIIIATSKLDNRDESMESSAARRGVRGHDLDSCLTSDFRFHRRQTAAIAQRLRENQVLFAD